MAIKNIIVKSIQPYVRSEPKKSKCINYVEHNKVYNKL